MPSNDEIRQLQEILLTAVMTGRALPGATRPVNFPDLAFIMGHPAVFLLDENLAGSISVEDSPLPLRILSRELLLEESRNREKDIAYLAFNYRALGEDGLQLTLEGKILPHDPNHAGVLGLSSIHVTFRKAAGTWEVAGDPSFSAA
ncbi:MAG: hypothetical protein NTW28_37295 [Candidatus Solibacter sp.]|nr:hypothetical protein [Candidatus Solibacter sp.]